MPYVDWWRARMTPEVLHAISGQVLRPVFGAMKLLWLRDAHPELFARTRRWLSVGDYLTWRLAGVAATDQSLASRTMLFDQRSRHWSGELLALAGLDADLLPLVYPSGTVIGGVSSEAAAATGLAMGTPVATGGHDHLCGGLAAGVVAPGHRWSDRHGRIAAGAQRNVPRRRRGLRAGAIVLLLRRRRLHCAGGLSAAGAALAWLARLLRGGAAPEDFAALDRAAADRRPARVA